MCVCVCVCFSFSFSLLKTWSRVGGAAEMPRPGDTKREREKKREGAQIGRVGVFIMKEGDTAKKHNAIWVGSGVKSVKNPYPLLRRPWLSISRAVGPTSSPSTALPSPLPQPFLLLPLIILIHAYYFIAFLFCFVFTTFFKMTIIVAFSCTCLV